MLKKNKAPLVFLLILLVGAVAAIPLRTYELFNIIDPQTGFYTQGSFTTVTLYVICAAVFALSIASGLIFKKNLNKLRIAQKDIFFGVCSALLAVAFIYNSFLCFNGFIELYTEYNELAQNFFGESQQLSLIKSSYVDKLGEAVFGSLCAVYFILTAMSAFTKFDISKIRFLALSPILWCVFRLIFRFMRTISYINVSELFYELLTIVLVMVFFMNYAQIRSKINYKGINWKLFAFGTPAAFFALICFVPRLILTVSGKAELITSTSSLEFTDAGIALFIISCLVSMLPSKKEAE